MTTTPIDLHIRVTNAPQKNVPVLSYAKTKKNAALIANTNPHLVVFTEAFSPITRAAIRSQFPREDWGYHAPLGNSTIIIWRRSRYVAERRWTLLGHGPIPRVSSARWIPIVRLRERTTDLTFIVAGIHPTPIPTRKAPEKVPEARKAQSLYFSRLSRFLSEHTRPTVLVGDWNDSSPVARLDLPRSRKAYPRGEGIIQTVYVDGPGRKFRHITKSKFQQPFSDHPAFRTNGVFY